MNLTDFRATAIETIADRTAGRSFADATERRTFRDALFAELVAACFPADEGETVPRWAAPIFKSAFSAA